jgi:hypothetical protein
LQNIILTIEFRLLVAPPVFGRLRNCVGNGLVLQVAAAQIDQDRLVQQVVAETGPDDPLEVRLVNTR